MTSSDRESALIFGLLLLGAGVTALWISVKQFRDPVGFTNALSKRFGGDHLPAWLRPSLAGFPWLGRYVAVGPAVSGVLFCGVAVSMLWSALAW